MADEDLLKQDDEKEQGKSKVVANDGKWTPRTEIRWNKHASTSDYFASLQWPSFMASLNAYFPHRELEIPPSKRKSYKNLQDAANIQWHRYIKNQITFVTAWNQILKSTKNGMHLGHAHAFVYILSIFAGFLPTLLYVLIWSRNMVNPT